MTLRTSASALAAASILLLALAGCATGADTSTTDTGTSTDDTSESSDDGGTFEGVTLPGTGEYTIPDQAPIGGFELPDSDTQPAGCTWQLYASNGELFVENQGSLVFLTDATSKFVTNGCPDWVQFE